MSPVHSFAGKLSDFHVKRFARISLKLDMDIGKILFTLTYVKYKQFDFSLLVNVKSIERKVFPSLLQEFQAVLFQY